MTTYTGPELLPDVIFHLLNCTLANNHFSDNHFSKRLLLSGLDGAGKLVFFLSPFSPANLLLLHLSSSTVEKHFSFLTSFLRVL